MPGGGGAARVGLGIHVISKEGYLRPFLVTLNAAAPTAIRGSWRMDIASMRQGAGNLRPDLPEVADPLGDIAPARLLPRALPLVSCCA